MFNTPLFYLLLLISNTLGAASFSYPENNGDSLIGDTSSLTRVFFSGYEDTLLDIARYFNAGQNEILRINPGVDRWLPGEGTLISIPHSRLLPATVHQGLVLNLPEFRLYYYPRQSNGQLKQVITHPISVGRAGCNTPLGKTRVTHKTRNPVWIPPLSIRKEHEASGDILPAIVPAGPDNPLGLFAIRLAIPGYLIHGTNKPYGIGMRVSHGCVRMYPEDIKGLFSQIKIGTQVNIINQAIKVGWSNNALFIEVYPDMEGQELAMEQRLEIAMELIAKANGETLPSLDTGGLRQALQQSTGIPVLIYRKNGMLPVKKGQKN